MGGWKWVGGWQRGKGGRGVSWVSEGKAGGVGGGGGGGGSWDIRVVERWWGAMFPLRLWMHYNVCVSAHREHTMS